MCFYHKVISNKNHIWYNIKNSKLRVIHILRSNTRTFEWSIRHLAPQDRSNCVFHEKVVSPQKYGTQFTMQRLVRYIIYNAKHGNGTCHVAASRLVDINPASSSLVLTHVPKPPMCAILTASLVFSASAHRGSSLIRNRPPLQDHHMALGMALL